MADDDADIPDAGAVFTFGKTKFNDNIPGQFWIRNDKVVQVACGDEHTALVAESGRLFTFGSNSCGQLGLKQDKVEKPTPVKALKREKVTLVACGFNHTIVGTMSGRIYGLGSNNECQIAQDGETITDSKKPVHIKNLPETEYKQISVGTHHSAVLTADGDLFLWGSSSEGQLGEDTENIIEPKLFVLPTKEAIKQVSCGSYFTLVLTKSGKLYAFGENDSYQLGLGDDNNRTEPTLVQIKEPLQNIACGGNHALALTSSGEVYSWGDGRYGQLGLGTRIKDNYCPEPTKIEGIGKIDQIYCGHSHSALLTKKGVLMTFGDGRHGKLGHGEDRFVNEFHPVVVERFRNIRVEGASCGGCHTIVLGSRKEENESSEEEQQHTVRNSLDSYRENLDLSASFTARKRRQDNLSSSINNKTLPTLNNSMKPSPRFEHSQGHPTRIEPMRRNGVKAAPLLRNDMDSIHGRKERMIEKSDSDEERSKIKPKEEQIDEETEQKIDSDKDEIEDYDKRDKDNREPKAEGDSKEDSSDYGANVRKTKKFDRKKIAKKSRKDTKTSKKSDEDEEECEKEEREKEKDESSNENEDDIDRNKLKEKVDSSKKGKSERPTPVARRSHSPVIKRRNNESADDDSGSDGSEESEETTPPPRVGHRNRAEASGNSRGRTSERDEQRARPKPVARQQKEKRKESEDDSGRESEDEREQA
ncbi:DgyrCDS10196 [Dimorphilus gyrociliatus]|uniref:DgyrCDS10196 n=1 Tax=Dimorphilus gyrociliatus TaxID=2664684 RepID=A0A7I8W226_9ANNE|nr:DgyrCDS10196 [Dimorphilus gyrociliatus]